MDFEKYTDKLKGYEMPFDLENSVQKIISIIDDL